MKTLTLINEDTYELKKGGLVKWSSGAYHNEDDSNMALNPLDSVLLVAKLHSQYNSKDFKNLEELEAAAARLVEFILSEFGSTAGA